MSWLALPPEIQEAILSNLRDDDVSTLRCELVHPSWRRMLLPLYRQKCLRVLRSRPKLRTTFEQHAFDDRSCDDSGWCKTFYFKLQRLLRRGWTGEPLVTVLNCLSAEVKGRRVEVSEEWKQRHNYTGVYDMVWDQETGLLTCSVFNTIQVWDMRTYECLSIIGADVLDSRGSNTSCFFAFKNLLVCGTERGFIKVFDLLNGNEIEQVRHSGHYLSDVKIFGSTLMAIDYYGEIQEWAVDHNQVKLKFVRGFRPPFRHSNPEVAETFQHRYWERLLDFNDQIIVTNCAQLLVIFSRAGDVISESCVITSGRILCCKVFGSEAYWGEQNGVVYRTSLRKNCWAQISEPDTSMDKVVTRFQDNVTSIDVSEQRVIIGDVNGEIHCCSHERFGKNENHLPDVVIETGHAYRSYVWSVHMDSCRIFSGDSDGKLVVHDFWDYSNP